ncbi:MAG TPA: hypothetical protein VLW84_00575 [Terriglobales bacterium]|nr:hypothetical protein [Terriglobales bacterium]
MLLLAVFLPFVYGGMGFLLGGLMAWLYNLVARWIGGIELEITASGVTQPPRRAAQS